MKLADIKDVLDEHLELLGEGVTARDYFERARTKILPLLARPESVEARGDPEEFGGPGAVASDICSGVVSLLTAALKMGVDPFEEIRERVQSIDEHTRCSNVTVEAGSMPGAGTKTEDAQASPAEKPVEDPAQTSLLSPSAPRETGQGGNGSSREDKTSDIPGLVRFYSRLFEQGSDPEKIVGAWAEITRNKDIPGPEKFRLQKKKDEALKRLKS